MLKTSKKARRLEKENAELRSRVKELERTHESLVSSLDESRRLSKVHYGNIISIGELIGVSLDDKAPWELVESIEEVLEDGIPNTSDTFSYLNKLYKMYDGKVSELYEKDLHDRTQFVTTHIISYWKRRVIEAENGVDEKEETNIDRKDGLTKKEGKVMDALINAWNNYQKLPKQHPDELGDFANRIHDCQSLLAIRVARREYPQGWIIKGGK